MALKIVRRYDANGRELTEKDLETFQMCIRDSIVSILQLAALAPSFLHLSLSDRVRTAVSYTHLDVYKRQVVHWLLSLGLDGGKMREDTH